MGRDRDLGGALQLAGSRKFSGERPTIRMQTSISVLAGQREAQRGLGRSVGYRDGANLRGGAIKLAIRATHKVDCRSRFVPHAFLFSNQADFGVPHTLPGLVRSSRLRSDRGFPDGAC